MTIKNGDLPAMPLWCANSDQQLYGLTKREELAARFMAAWIIHHGASGDYGYSSQAAALGAIQDADALLEQLELNK